MILYRPALARSRASRYCLKVSVLLRYGRWYTHLNQLCHLVPHEGHQRRDHQRDSRQQQGRDLVAYGFPGSGGHDAHGIPVRTVARRSPAPVRRERRRSQNRFSGLPLWSWFPSFLLTRTIVPQIPPSWDKDFLFTPPEVPRGSLGLRTGQRPLDLAGSGLLRRRKGSFLQREDERGHRCGHRPPVSGNLAAVFQDHCWEGEVQPPSDGFRDVPEPGPQGAQGEGQKLSGLG